MSAFKIETAVTALGVPTLLDYQVRFTKAHLARRRGVPVDSITVSKDLQELSLVAVPSNEYLQAEVNCGRWVGLCACGAGIALNPAWEWGGCLDCGAVYTDVAFPDAPTLKSVMALLSVRPNGPRSNRHKYRSWEPTETAVDLHRENRRNGWGE